ncbi:hypothetical protein ON010_g7530 [Phytophthora cinnamomi]|nr:hypothetical protein ON010_g7530 [Phytophthora cinnamomi]
MIIPTLGFSAKPHLGRQVSAAPRSYRSSVERHLTVNKTKQHNNNYVDRDLSTKLFVTRYFSISIFLLIQQRIIIQDEGNAYSFAFALQGDESFDLPAMDAFPASEFAEQAPGQQKMPADDEFVDAATFLKKNELGGDDSFSEDVGPTTGDNWGQVNSSGRPSDFFETKSRNLDHVELSSPRNVDDPLVQICSVVDRFCELWLTAVVGAEQYEGDALEDEVEDPGVLYTKEATVPN